MVMNVVYQLVLSRSPIPLRFAVQIICLPNANQSVHVVLHIVLYASKLPVPQNLVCVRTVRRRSINHVYQLTVKKNPRVGHVKFVELVSNHCMEIYVGLKWVNFGKKEEEKLSFIYNDD